MANEADLDAAIADLKTEIGERVGAIGLGELVLPFNVVDVYAEHPVAAFDTLHDFVANPSPRPSLRPDQDRCHGAVLELAVDKPL